MKILVFDADQAVREIFDAALPGHALIYIDERVSLERLREHQDAEAVSLFVSSSFPKECFDALPALKVIAARSTGVDHIDAAEAKARGIAIANVPSYGARTVAEFTFALILSISRRLPEASNQVKQDGRFDTAPLEGFDIGGKTLGVVGTGAIGKGVARIAQGFGMRVLMYDKFPAQGLENENAKYVPLDELLADSDIITLHVPYVPENKHLLNADAFAKMKRGAYVINTARGELIDTQALLEALESGVVAGAGLDVLEGEKALKDEIDLIAKGSIDALKDVIRDHALIGRANVIVTPHIAFFSREAYHEILSMSAKNIASYAVGAPEHIVALSV